MSHEVNGRRFNVSHRELLFDCIIISPSLHFNLFLTLSELACSWHYGPGIIHFDNQTIVVARRSFPTARRDRSHIDRRITRQAEKNM